MEKYRFYDLKIGSDLSFPEQHKYQFDEPDVIIERGVIEDMPEAITSGSRFFQASDDVFHLVMPDICRYKVENGVRITYEPLEHATKERIRTQLLASGLGAILHQRNYLVLHGSAVIHNDEAVLFCGESGIGKSTTAALFMQAGFDIICDDLCAIKLENGELFLGESYMNIKLWDEVVEQLGLNSADVYSLGPHIEKSGFKLHPYDDNRKYRIRAIYHLDQSLIPKPTITTLKGMEALECLVDNTFKYPYIEKTLKVKQDLIRYGMLANKATVKRVTRPSEGTSMQQFFQFLLDDLANG